MTRNLWGGVLLTLGLALTPPAASREWEGTLQQAFLEGPIVAKYQCTTCHTVTEEGGTVGPILNNVGLRRDEDWLRRWLADPQAVKPGTKMPKFEFTPDEFEAAAAALSRLRRPVDSRGILSGAGTAVEKGERLFRAYDCLACHRIGREGRFVGPDLTWLALRKMRGWERTWLSDPPGFKPDTFMPDFHLAPEEIEVLTAYLETLRGQANEDSQSWEFMINLYLNNKAYRRGELVFKRFACWACHGEQGRGGIPNPNAADDEMTIPLTGATLDNTPEELRSVLAERRAPRPLDASADPPFFCHDYSGTITDQEFKYLYANLESIAPKKCKWKIR